MPLLQLKLQPTTTRRRDKLLLDQCHSDQAQLAKLKPPQLGIAATNIAIANTLKKPWKIGRCAIAKGEALNF
ncbi:MAG: hypothetical protein WBL95_06685 [Microcoleus sp.]